MNMRSQFDVDRAIRNAAEMAELQHERSGLRWRQPTVRFVDFVRLLDALPDDEAEVLDDGDDRSADAAADSEVNLRSPSGTLGTLPGASRDTLDHAITGSLAAAEEVHRLHQAF